MESPCKQKEQGPIQGTVVGFRKSTSKNLQFFGSSTFQNPGKDKIWGRPWPTPWGRPWGRPWCGGGQFSQKEKNGNLNNF